uniref:Uncharacterized protein n=1 Tax=Anguilla anguilla TaxID=7936 RepID=A0A0E9WIM6_ANGAN
MSCRRNFLCNWPCKLNCKRLPFHATDSPTQRRVIIHSRN